MWVRAEPWTRTDPWWTVVVTEFDATASAVGPLAHTIHTTGPTN